MVWLWQQWNFYLLLGLVGGHCIGVDPYYSTRVDIGYHPNYFAERRSNDSEGAYTGRRWWLC